MTTKCCVLRIVAYLKIPWKVSIWVTSARAHLGSHRRHGATAFGIGIVCVFLYYGFSVLNHYFVVERDFLSFFVCLLNMSRNETIIGRIRGLAKTLAWEMLGGSKGTKTKWMSGLLVGCQVSLHIRSFPRTTLYAQVIAWTFITTRWLQGFSGRLGQVPCFESWLYKVITYSWLEDQESWFLYNQLSTSPEHNKGSYMSIGEAPPSPFWHGTGAKRSSCQRQAGRWGSLKHIRDSHGPHTAYRKGSWSQDTGWNR